jgi:methylthioribose-1-phosphate isomerase
MAQTYDTFWQQRYARHLRLLIESQTQVLAAGNAVDFAQYNAMVGVIRGLSMALEAIEEVNDEIRQAEQGSK